MRVRPFCQNCVRLLNRRAGRAARIHGRLAVQLAGGFGLLVLLHLILHWSWVCSFVASRLSKFTGRQVTVNESSKTIWGVATLIFVLTCIGAVLLVAEFSVVTGR